MALVSAQVPEATSALLAAVGCGPAVDALVGVQVAQLLKAPATLRAGVGALPSVYPLVALQARQHREALATLRAGEGALRTTVAQPVALEAGGVAEALSTLRANERLLPRMDALVLPQVAQIVEVPATVSTLVAPRPLLLSRSPSRCSLLPFAFPGAHTGLTQRCRRAGRRRQRLGVAVHVHQLQVLLQKQGIGTEGSAERAEVSMSRKLLTWR